MRRRTGGPKPDFPRPARCTRTGSRPIPRTRSRRSARTTPGLGSKVLSYTNNSAPAPPTPFDQNQAWQAVNKELNADVQFTIIAQADYLAKLATVMAGNDLPDIMLIPGPAPAARRGPGLTPVPGRPVRRSDALPGR